MKSLRTFTAILVMAAFSFTGCKNKSTKEWLVQKWKVTDMSGGMAAQMPDSLRKQVLGNTAIEFTSDGKYILTSMDVSSHTGTYTLSADEKTLTITPDKTGKPEINIINGLSENKLAFTDAFGTKLVAVSR